MLSETGLLKKADRSFSRLIKNSNLTDKQTIRKLECYRTIFDIIQEVNEITDEQKFIENFSLLVKNQIDASTITLFLISDINQSILKPMFSSNYDIKDLITRNQYLNENDYLYNLLKEKQETIKISSIEKKYLTLCEMDIIESNSSKLILPVVSKNGKLMAVFFIGEAEHSIDYIYDDIYFLGLVAQFFSSIYHRLYKNLKINEKYNYLSKKQDIQFSLLSLFQDLPQNNTLELFYNQLNVIFNQLLINRYMIFSRSEEDFFQVDINFISPTLKEEIKIEEKSNLIRDILKKKTVSFYSCSLKKYPELSKLFYYQFNKVQLLPFMFHNRLLGFLILLEKDFLNIQPYKDYFFTLSHMIALFQNHFLYQKKISILQNDPFIVIDRFIESHFSNRESSEKSFVRFAVLKIKNITRMIHFKGKRFFLEQENKLSHLLDSNLEHYQYFRISYGKFLIIFFKSDEFFSDSILNKIGSSFTQTGQISQDFSVLITHKVLNCDDLDIVANKEKFFEEIEDF